MRAMERQVLLRKLDKEMRHYRLAAREENPTNELLRTVRKVLRVPMKEMAEKMGIVESALFQLEGREGTGSITLRSLARMAEAMGCKAVYGVVPANGKTLEELAEERMWREVLGEQGPSHPSEQRPLAGGPGREQGTKGTRKPETQGTREQESKGPRDQRNNADEKAA
jgi:transcriptional regulator with XRE-family HTH domain